MRWVAPCLAAALLLVACGSHPRDVLFASHTDSGAGDAGYDAESGADSHGIDGGGALGGPCVDDAQCDDHIACTYESCDLTANRCHYVPDDAQCDNGVYCDGRERCVVGHGCEPGPVVTCDDGDPCTTDRCVESTRSCSHAARDLDQDGDADGHCPGGHDCDDLDPTVSSLHSEVCANHKDDNCNGLVDEQPCVSPSGATCATAVSVGGSGTFALSTVGHDKTFATSCTVSMPQAGRDVVAAVTVPPGPNVDLEVWATSANGEVSVAIQRACGAPTSELACGSGASATSVRARARSVAPGTYYVIATTQTEANLELAVDFLPASATPYNTACASALPIQANTATSVSLIDAPSALASACTAGTGALTYQLTLAQAQDVRVDASTVRGSGFPVIGLRAPHCVDATDELRCSQAGSASLYARNLPAGAYVITVAGTAPIDASILARVSAPTVAPPDQTCATAPAIAPNGRVAFDLSNHEYAIADGCFLGAADAAYALTLTVPSDVLLLGRFAQSETGALSFDTPSCDTRTTLGCDSGGTPRRLAKRNVAPGSYRVVVGDQLGLQGTVDALVRSTVSPTVIPPGGADTCAHAVDVSNGGYFIGDTSAATAHYDNPCDAPTSPPKGAPDQVLSLNLTSARRVVLDMEGSAYATLLDVRQGPACPGTPVTGACYVGLLPTERSFLDLQLAAGQYWVLVDGYTQAKGAWAMDVRVLPP
ncbi:MAG: putative metal-binding motif-containing protein [Myxococcota bacterium]|nr:putative metal-binding motif-containing protein [Myxococcota bacterium]